MIYVSRHRRDQRGRRIKPSKQWFKDARALTRTAKRERAAHRVDPHYRAPEVKAALEKLFHGKCAYCETPLPEVDWNVEHYRPKHSVYERPYHPGYYWLAYTWSNLYPACVPCNQRRSDPQHWDDPRTGDPRGKHDQFPIDEEKGRAMEHEDALDNELPHLLDPCADEPSLYLEYNSLGEIRAIDDNVFGAETVRICHLGRKRLTRARRKKVARMVKLLRSLRTVQQLGDPAAEDIIRELLDDELAVDAAFASLALAIEEDPDHFGV